MVAIVIPSYRVKNKILEVINNIGNEVDKIIMIDDECPDNSGKFVLDNSNDKRLEVIFHKKNKGVGGATISGYLKALELKADIIIKLDGDGQMNPKLIPKFIKQFELSGADYVKGNRFFDIKSLRKMPSVRLVGNSVLSLLNKFVNGYWNIVDPTNGYTAITNYTLSLMPLEKIDNRYFFESDMLFRLNILRAKVVDLPMRAIYNDEESSLNVWLIAFKFPPKYIYRFFKRIFYNYFLHDFNIASIQLTLGFLLFISGLIVGIYNWIISIETGVTATSGTVMLAALPIIIGFQLLISALNFDINNIPKKSISEINI